jgi:hypothetical protein
MLLEYWEKFRLTQKDRQAQLASVGRGAAWPLSGMNWPIFLPARTIPGIGP